MCLTTASLRRSFRHRKDHRGSPGEPSTPDTNQVEFLIYEEVTQYCPRPGERPRLIVLIGRCLLTLQIYCIFHALVLISVRYSVDCTVTGSLGARVTELKQKVIAENPRRYGLAVPRKFNFVFSLHVMLYSNMAKNI